ncbi:hypothetical protein N9L01_00420 [bacterium]|nr:hypothetical protein [bacterium]
MTDDWEKISLPTLITAKQMIYLILGLEVIIQIIFISLAYLSNMDTFSIDWWILQFNGLVVATNIGAVVLAILAQKTANEIGATQARVLTPDFYRTVAALTDVKVSFDNAAAAEGRDPKDDLIELGPVLYDYLRAFSLQRSIEPIQAPDPSDLGVPQAPPEPEGGWTEDDLFGDAS